MLMCGDPSPASACPSAMQNVRIQRTRESSRRLVDIVRQLDCRSAQSAVLDSGDAAAGLAETRDAGAGERSEGGDGHGESVVSAGVSAGAGGLRVC